MRDGPTPAPSFVYHEICELVNNPEVKVGVNSPTHGAWRRTAQNFSQSSHSARNILQSERGGSTCCLADTLQLHGVVPVLHAVHAGVAADAVKAGWLLVVLVVVMVVSLPD